MSELIYVAKSNQSLKVCRQLMQGRHVEYSSFIFKIVADTPYTTFLTTRDTALLYLQLYIVRSQFVSRFKGTRFALAR